VASVAKNKGRGRGLRQKEEPEQIVGKRKNSSPAQSCKKEEAGFKEKTVGKIE